LHSCVAGQTVPHVPQLFRSNWVLRHWVPHFVRPTLQVHTPCEHPCVAAVPGQTLPHAPQLLRSFCRSRHWPLQLVKPTLHWQLPATQNWLKLQVTLQPPQLLRSL